MQMKIFALAFSVGFMFCLSAAVFFAFGLGGTTAPEEALPETENIVYLEEDFATFLLVYRDKASYGPFSLVCFDAKVGRIPVFTFSGKAAVAYGGVYVPAGELFSSVSPEVFAGAVEQNFGIELSGYFIWNRESAEEIFSKTGSFDYILPKSLYYSDENRYINLISGVQSINGKKFWDIATFPKFSESERCDIVSRMGAAFFNRRLRRFLPESSVYSVIFNYMETDVSAYDKQRYAKIIEVLTLSGESLAGHITCDTEKNLSTGLFYFSEETLERVKKYFG